MSNPLATVQAFVLEKLDGEPFERRAALYRALSQIAGTQEDAEQLRKMADQVERTSDLHRSLLGSIRRKSDTL